MGVSPDEVRRVAALARLELDDGEVDALARDLKAILEHVDALADGVPPEPPDGPSPDDDRPRSDPPAASVRPVLDDDVPGGDPLTRPPASFAPAFDGGHFTVPRLASHARTEPDGRARPDGGGDPAPGAGGS